MISFYLLSIIAIFASCAHSQLISDPSWTKPNISTSKQERIRVAAQALDTTIRMLDSNLILPSEGDNVPLSNTARLFTQLSDFDRLLNLTRYKDQVSRYFELRGAVGSNNVMPTNESFNANYMLLYGNAALHANLAYGDAPEWRPDVLSDLTRTLDALSLHERDPLPPIPLGLSSALFLNESLQAVLMDDCDDSGRLIHPDSPSVSFYTNALWLKYSTLSYIQTDDAAFRNRVGLTSKVLANLDQGLNIRWRNSDCSARDNSWTSGAGALFIESLARFGTVSNVFDATLLKERTSWSIEGMNPPEQGMIDHRTIPGCNASSSNYMAYRVVGEYIHSLSSSYQHLAAFQDIQSYMQGFISNQYNEMLDNMTSTNTHYGNWNTTETGPLNVDERLSMTYTLLAGINMPETSNGTFQLGNIQTSKVSVGVVAGIVVGSILLTVITVLGGAFCARRCGFWRKDVVPPASEPFTLQVTDKQVVTSGNAPKHWQLKDRRPNSNERAGTSNAPAVDSTNPCTATQLPYQEPGVLPAPTRRADEVLEQLDEEHEQDSGWRPNITPRRLPPTYEDAL
ncbi:hypothetical protein VNI00_010232 [Paramarasmius palmivorus]|uniref:Glycoside hydrolase family 76 protein n=1 Tax=Paramarasmius palmivorus TaxID=297713 RepID=A0AAW0CH71_9AGAR